MSDTAIRVWVRALPPTVNHMYLPNARGGKRLSPEAELFRSLVWTEVVSTQPRPAVPDAGPLALTVRLTFGTKRRQDLDNRLKAAQDALALALAFDDARIKRLTVEDAGHDKGRPACEMVLEVLP